MNTNQRDLKTAVEALGGDDAPWVYTDLHVRTGRKGRVTVSWTAGASIDEVTTAVDALAVGLDESGGPLDVRYDRTAVWTCGGFHPSPGEAFLAHEGRHLLVGITVPGCCEECWDTEQVVDRDALVAHVDAGAPTSSSCRPCPTGVPCPDCEQGERFDRRTLDRRPCGTCDARGWFDTADDVERDAAEAAWRDDAAPTTQTRDRVLP